MITWKHFTYRVVGRRDVEENIVQTIYTISDAEELLFVKYRNEYKSIPEWYADDD